MTVHQSERQSIGRPSIRVALVIAILSSSATAADESRVGKIGAGNFSGSLSQDQDRFAESTLRAAQADFQKGDVRSGVRRLQELFDREPDSLVLLDGVYRRASDAAGRLLLQGADGRRETYERIFGAIADQELSKALKADDRPTTERVAHRYRYTAAGREAGLYLAALAIDEGDRDAAAEWLSFVAGGRSADGTERGPARFASRLMRLVPVVTDDVVKSDLDPKDLPAAPTSLTNVRWRADVPMTEAAQREIAASLSVLDAQAILPLLSAKPLVHEGVVYSRRLGGIAAIDLQSGGLLWECDIPTGVSRLVTEPVDFANRVRRSSSTALFLERLVRSSLTDHLSSDGSRVFVVIPASPPWTNTLIALSAEDGRPLWTAGAEWNGNGQIASASADVGAVGDPPRARLTHDSRLDDVSFLGPPQPLGEWRLVIGQRESSVSLFALDARTGTLGWSAPLGRAVRTLEDDKPRHGTACPVLLHNGRAYCPTAAGCLACVDVRSRQLLWAFRYPRDDLPRVSHDEESGRADTTHATHMPTRSTWHEVFLRLSDGVLLLASPDSDWLYALDAKSGQLQWAVARGGGVFAAGPRGGHVVVIGTSNATALTVAEGQAAWSTEIARPAGTGVATESAYVFPTQSGGLQSVRWDDGTALLRENAPRDAPVAVIGDRQLPVSIHPPSKLPPVEARNLAAAGDEVLVLSCTGLACVGLSQQDRLHESRPDIALAGDDRATAAPELDDLWNVFDEAGWAVPLERARAIVHSTRPAIGAAELMFASARQLSPFIRSPDERVSGLITELAASLQADSSSGGLSPSTELFLQRLARQPLDDLYVTLSDPRRSVRIDRWLPSGFADVSTDDAALRRSYRAAVSALIPEALPGVTEQRANESNSGPALFQWPDGHPVVSERPSRGVRHVDTVPLSVVGESPWERVTIQVDRQQQNLWFERADAAAPAAIPLLPQRGGQLTSEFLHAWADGPMLCLRVGTDLYGFQMAPDGVLPTSPLWPRGRTARSIAGERPPLAMGLSEVNDDPRPLWDDSIPGYFDNFSRPLGVVGPFRGGYLCYQVRGDLVAIDPLTGRELWCRSGIPAGTYCVGDDDSIVLLCDEGETVEVLRSRDGALIGKWEWGSLFAGAEDAGAVFSHLVAVNGTCGIWHSHPPQLHENDPFAVRPGDQTGDSIAVGIDLVAGRRLWSSDLDAGSWVFAIDHRLLGTLSPQGELEMREWKTGKVVAEHNVTVPPQITKVVTFTDADAAYVMASGRPDDRHVLGVRQSRGGDRRPLVNGWMHAFSRDTGEHLWEQELKNVGMAIDPMRHVPLLVTGFMKREGTSNNSTVGVLQCFDKRTGELLYEKVQPYPAFFYHTVRAEAEQKRVIVETEHVAIRFQYQADESASQPAD